MLKLKCIMRIKEPDKRIKELEQLAIKLGVSMTRHVDAYTGRIEEQILIERIQQAYLVHIAQRNWAIALIAGIASVVSAIVACLALSINQCK